MTLEEQQRAAFVAWQNVGFRDGKERDAYNIVTAIVIDSLKDEVNRVANCDIENNDCLNCGS